MRRDGPDCRIVILAVIIRLFDYYYFFFFFFSSSAVGLVMSVMTIHPHRCPLFHFGPVYTFQTSSRFFLPLLLLSTFGLQNSAHSYLLIPPFSS